MDSGAAGGVRAGVPVDLVLEPGPGRGRVRRGRGRIAILPVKAAFILIVIYSLYFSSWFENVALPQTDAQKAVERFFPVYLLLNIVVAAVLLFFHRKMSAVLV